jgi:hypothetical protein
MGYYSLIMLRSHHRWSDALACTVPRLLSLWVRKELLHCLGMRGVELVDGDTVVGVLVCRGRFHLSVEQSHPLHHPPLPA